VNSSSRIRQMMLRQVVGLVHTIGISAQLLQLFNNFPRGAENFILQILHILTENSSAPAAQLVASVRSLYKRVPDSRFLIPVLTGLSKDELESVLPKFLEKKDEKDSKVLKAVIHKLLHTLPAPISASELLVYLHTLDHAKDNVSLKKIIEAMELCFDNKNIYKQEVLAVVLQQLVEINPIPQLLMRTMIKALKMSPKLTNFVITLLTRLITKQIWNQKVLWDGFIKCCALTKPHCFSILLTLPAPQLEDIVRQLPDIKAQLAQAAKNSNTPRSILQALGVQTDDRVN